ncbi:nitroreductase family protein [uncultured Desulfosarcina sp.]|uniref:nitroreductase family protein n=1 Tax=uncultured Desulfosarcina sp. TaxID=218289 RepID=UPI0029C6FF5F|nr:nitroreductase family protein [uncultured Desulfosarcina sp.]
MALLTIDESTCNRDGICAAVCPTGTIDFSKGEVPRLVNDAREYCIACGHCVAVCPTASISHEKMSPDQCPPIRPELRLTAEQCEQFLRSRRSIRRYKDEPVDRSKIQKIIEIASHAPSGHNSQSAQWRVIDNRDRIEMLAATVIEWMRWMMDNQPEVAAVLHMARAVERWEAGDDVILRGAPALVVAHAPKNDFAAPPACTIALAYMELAAVPMGLGACWAGYFWAASQGFPAMVKALDLPSGHRCYGALMVGYPRFTYQRLPLRRQPVVSWWDEG